MIFPLVNLRNVPVTEDSNFIYSQNKQSTLNVLNCRFFTIYYFLFSYFQIQGELFANLLSFSEIKSDFIVSLI